MPGTNITMLQIVANGLGELKDEMAFVGGAVAELYANDPAASDIRPTLDVDCIIELSTRTEHARMNYLAAELTRYQNKVSCCL